MKDLNDIISPIAAELQRFEVYFDRALRAGTLPMGTILHYVQETKGKRLRPILVLLSAKLFGEVNERTLCAATFVEMVHSATLLHDDVVDDADQRRGRDSVNARFGNHSAVLAGDYLLAQAFLLCDDSAMLSEMLQTAAAMSEGELMQLQRNDTDYLDIVTRKTAVLMRSCCVVGAMSVGATNKQMQQIADFGLSFGQLFPIRDDILDADDSKTLSLAQKMLPSYLQKTQNLLRAFPDSETRDALEKLTLFCAEREV